MSTMFGALVCCIAICQARAFCLFVGLVDSMLLICIECLEGIFGKTHIFEMSRAKNIGGQIIGSRCCALFRPPSSPSFESDSDAAH